MRAPRALIPLLAVCGAAAVVVTAGVGAAIEGAPGMGPLQADAVREVPPAATVTAMTWNVCGNLYAHCPLGARPAELAKKIVQNMTGNKVGGRAVGVNAVLLQEVCAGHVKTIARYGRLRSWSWAFAPLPKAGGKAETCANGQGRFGVAIGAERKIAGVQRTSLPSPRDQGRAAVCGHVDAWGTQVCSAQLSSNAAGDDPRGEWRRKQTKRLVELAGGDRVILGGDFGDRPEQPSLDVLYRGYAECDQGPGTIRTGAPTYQGAGGKAVEKVDYLFASKSAGMSCGVPDTPVASSDHRPVLSVVRFN